MIVCLDANIGAGKSTILRSMQACGVHVIPEPVGDGRTEGKWDAQLVGVYAGVEGAALAFQHTVISDRVLDDRIAAAGTAPHSWTVMERSPQFQQHTFVKANGFAERDVELLESRYAESKW